MVRSFVLLALPLLVVGCGSSSEKSPPTIDSFRSSYFGQESSGQSSGAQVAAMPAPPPDQGNADAAAKPQAAAAAAAAQHKPAGPPAYEASVAAYIKRYAVDDNSLKLAKIGTPFDGSVNGQKGSVVCVELGGMSSNRTAYLLKDNEVVDSEFGAAACRDKKLAPWDSAGA